MLKNFLTFILQWVAITFISWVLLVVFRPESDTTLTILFLLATFSPPILIYWYRRNQRKEKEEQERIASLNIPPAEKFNDLITNISKSQDPVIAYDHEYDELSKQKGDVSFTEAQQTELQGAIVSRYCELKQVPSTLWQDTIRKGSAFVFKSDEAPIYQTTCDNYETTKRERHYEAGNRGMSLRLMKGVSVRVGNTAGKSVAEDVPVKYSSSQIVLTTKSLYYFESESPKRILFKNVIGADIINNGCSIKIVQEGIRSKPVCFNFDSATPPALIRQIITTDW